MYGCPANSFCQFGFCECNPGLTKTMVVFPFLPPWHIAPHSFSPSFLLWTFILILPFQGGCYPGNQRPPPRASDFQPFQDCASTSTCLAVDMNLICNTNLTMGGQGKCQCRTNMRWNTEAGECQVDFQPLEDFDELINLWLCLHPSSPDLHGCGLFWHHLWHPTLPHHTGGSGKGQAKAERNRRFSWKFRFMFNVALMTEPSLYTLW